MPVVVFQLYPETLTESSTSADRASTQKWKAVGSETTAEVMVALALALPTQYLGLWLQRYTPEHVGGGVWRVDVSYGPLRPLATEGYKVNFKVNVESQKVEQSLNTVTRFGVTGLSIPDFNNLIGVNGDKVDGVEMQFPKVGCQVTKKFAVDTLPSTYLDDVISLTGKTNEEEFVLSWLGLEFTAAAGEALFLGASIDDGGQDVDETQLVSVVMEFAISRNVAGLVIGEITDIAKGGWEYLWVRYEQERSNNVYVKRPVFVYIEQIYESGNFDVLEL